MTNLAKLWVAITLLFITCQPRVEPASDCRLTIRENTDTYTYQFDEAGKLIASQTITAGGSADFRYTYQGNKATIDVTYPSSSWLRIQYDLTLNLDGYAVTAQQTMYNQLANGTTQESVTATHTFAYDAQGYLVNHQADEFSYPPGGVKIIKHSAAHLTYQDGNPVTIEVALSTAGTAPSVSTISNRYGQQANPLKIPFLLEFNPFGFNISRYLQPFLGKPAQRLLTASDNQQAGRPTNSTAYTYQVDPSGNLVGVNRTGVYSITSSLENHCP
ncbi:DUF4595 domain-containing protein [Spirosoma endophyticum]|uniref:YD repeat-containing protein n=1 Tax=Spirosoma endophyticum TaxID=662367 RepID=A0A1I1XN33_9BACT|nr:DUF4595 domain-containing protein [Spirosoma endophyticum]SFE06850.1 YD repeat-containing protein [Spirosoma endophyticum]